MRLDLFLTENKYYPSRSQASLAIKEGKVKVNNRIINKPGLEISENDQIECLKPTKDFVSRAGYKLQAAIDNFNIVLNNKIVLDIGASTGGFTDCVLQANAKKAYSYDVGHDQLAEKIRNDERVVVKEGINCRYLTKNDFNENVDFICMDVSFISCTKMFDAITDILSVDKEAVILFKPQFEVGNEALNGQGIAKSDKITKEKLELTIKLANEKGLKLVDQMLSPITGGDGNKEYLLYFIKDNQAL